MARTVTLLQLRLDARLYAEQRTTDENKSFVSSIELTRLANLALAELYDLLVAARGHEYYRKSATIALVPGTSTYALDSAFYEMLRAEIEWSATDVEPLCSFEHQERVDYINTASTWGKWTPKAYRLNSIATTAGTVNIEIVPTPNAAATLRTIFIPACPVLSFDGDTFDGVNGWEKLVIFKMALELCTIDKTDQGDLPQRYAEQVERVKAMAANRNALEPKRVVDVFPEGGGYRGRSRYNYGPPRYS
jgi:hypothetical protein